jgi:hypothetical protein
MIFKFFCRKKKKVIFFFNSWFKPLYIRIKQFVLFVKKFYFTLLYLIIEKIIFSLFFFCACFIHTNFKIIKMAKAFTMIYYYLPQDCDTPDVLNAFGWGIHILILKPFQYHERYYQNNNGRSQAKFSSHGHIPF